MGPGSGPEEEMREEGDATDPFETIFAKRGEVQKRSGSKKVVSTSTVDQKRPRNISCCLTIRILTATGGPDKTALCFLTSSTDFNLTVSIGSLMAGCCCVWSSAQYSADRPAISPDLPRPAVRAAYCAPARARQLPSPGLAVQCRDCGPLQPVVPCRCGGTVVREEWAGVGAPLLCTALPQSSPLRPTRTTARPPPRPRPAPVRAGLQGGGGRCTVDRLVPAPRRQTGLGYHCCWQCRAQSWPAHSTQPSCSVT